MNKALSPQERIKNAREGLAMELKLHATISETIDAVHKAHVDTFVQILDKAWEDLWEEVYLDRLLYLCKTGRSHDEKS